MNARDKLFRDIWDMRSTAEKNALIDAYAHELAEKIRERARRIEESGESATGRHAEDVATRRRAWDTAADLIDPKSGRDEG